MQVSKAFCAVALATILSAAGALQAAEVAGVRLDDKVQVAGSDLVLNGAGVRSKLFIKVYVGALYAGQKVTGASAIIDQPGPRRMLLKMLRDLDADSLNKALEEGLQANNTPAELAAIRAQADQLAAIMRNIGKAREGDAIAIDVTGDGVAIMLNGEARGKVQGPGLGGALLKVWLGDKPVDAGLKKALLGH